jgi:ABC-2 type transport system ATP-binding protein
MEHAVDVRGLTKVYEGKVRALDGVDLRVDAGKVFAVLGPNGAGKTTLIRILTTQLKPTSGAASVFGLDVVRDGAKIRRLVGYVPQEMSVWTDISGYENLLVYAKIYNVPSPKKRVIEDVLGKMGLSDVGNQLVKTYSGGMIRRLEIACTLLTKPRILFLDEPTIGLDPSARKAVWEELASIREEHGSTIFFNTHYMDEADLYSDEIAIINGGKIVKLGTTAELKRSVGGEVIMLGIESNSVKQDTLNEIRKLNSVNDIIMNNSGLTVITKDAESLLPDVVEVLREEGISVTNASITKPTLDDVFQKYAGIRLESGGRISDVTQTRRMIKRG